MKAYEIWRNSTLILSTLYKDEFYKKINELKAKFPKVKFYTKMTNLKKEEAYV
jgi:hypothetical protein